MSGAVGHKSPQVAVARLPERKQSRVGRGGAGVLEFGTEKIDNLEVGALIASADIVFLAWHTPFEDQRNS